MGSAFEIVAIGSTPCSERAAVSAGLIILNRTPIYWWSRKMILPPIPLEFQIADNDAVFLSSGGPSGKA